MGSFEFCAGCKAFESLVYYEIGTDGDLRALCSKCRKGTAKGSPDVYFNPKDGAVQTEENIADKRTGAPIPFWDKTSKKAAMDAAGVREAGDRRHGERLDFTKRAKYFV